MAKQRSRATTERLLGVIGVKTVRLAVQSAGGRPRHQQIIGSDKGSSLQAVLRAYLNRFGVRPQDGAFAAGVLGFLRPKFNHISAVRILSGPGLVNLYKAVAPIEGRQPLRLTPGAIMRRAASGECQVCADVIAMFSDMLGTVASNLALSTGARGGVYIAGAIVGQMGDTFNGRRFRQRFENKGRLSKYLAAIPTYLITHPWPAFLGLAHLLDTESIQ